MTAESPPPYLVLCPMRCGEVVRLLRVIATHAVFTGIGVSVNANRKSLPPFQAKQIANNQALVTLAIPQDTDMAYFFGDFSKALNAKE